MIMVELHLYAVWWCSLQARGRSPPAAPPTSFPTLSCTPLHMIKHSSTLLHILTTLAHSYTWSNTPAHPCTWRWRWRWRRQPACCAVREGVQCGPWQELGCIGSRLCLPTARAPLCLLALPPHPEQNWTLLIKKLLPAWNFHLTKKVSKNEVRVVRRTFFYSKSCAMFCRSLDHQNCH